MSMSVGLLWVWVWVLSIKSLPACVIIYTPVLFWSTSLHDYTRVWLMLAFGSCYQYCYVIDIMSMFMYDMLMRFGYATLRRFLCSMHYCLISTQNVFAIIDISISIIIIIIASYLLYFVDLPVRIVCSCVYEEFPSEQQQKSLVRKMVHLRTKMHRWGQGPVMCPVARAASWPEYDCRWLRAAPPVAVNSATRQGEDEVDGRCWDLDYDAGARSPVSSGASAHSDAPSHLIEIMWLRTVPRSSNSSSRWLRTAPPFFSAAIF